jgi:hypothetical protein
LPLAHDCKSLLLTSLLSLGLFEYTDGFCKSAAAEKHTLPPTEGDFQASCVS